MCVYAASVLLPPVHALRIYLSGIVVANEHLQARHVVFKEGALINQNFRYAIGNPARNSKCMYASSCPILDDGLCTYTYLEQIAVLDLLGVVDNLQIQR